MKIVQINTFPYKATGSIMMGIHKLLLENGHDSYVVWGRGRDAENKREIVIKDDIGTKFHGVYTRLTDRTGFASWNATSKLLERLDEIEPDIIHLHNVHGYYINIEMLFSYIRKRRIKVVWTLHDCWAFTGHCAYFDMVGCEKWKTACNHCAQKKTYPASIAWDGSNRNWERKKALFTGLNVTLVTPCKWLKDLVSQSYLSAYPTQVIYNGINRELFKPTVDSNVRSKFGMDARPIILGVASEWTERKGLKDIVALAAEMDKYQFVVVGLTEAQKKALPGTVKGITRTNNIHELVALYSMASVFFNPTYEDNFPTTNIEALACGTPILTYDTGGSPEAVVSADAGSVVEKESRGKADLNRVKEVLESMIQARYPGKLNGIRNDKTESDENTALDRNAYIRLQCRKASEQFDMNRRLQEYIPLYESILNHKQVARTEEYTV